MKTKTVTEKFKSFPGMDDILPGDVAKWQWLESKARVFFESRGFKEIRTPILEPTELFSRSIGEASDIVHKEMYSFMDRGERNMTMRPEMTASVARSVIENGLLKTNKSLRVYYSGPMFRAERPQGGRKRQFHQVGAEIINETGVEIDAEIICAIYDFLAYVGLKELTLKLNDIGTQEDRKSIVAGLTDYFSKEKSKLCKDCNWRLEKNVLRIFDCKEKGCQPVIDKAPWESIAPQSDAFDLLRKSLDQQEIAYEINRRLVRGLDYYNGAVFEITAKGLGAQDAVAGGGRYDLLYEHLGGTPTPCTGFSLGVERLLASLEKQGVNIQQQIHQKTIYFAALEQSAEAIRICRAKALELREKGFFVEMTFGSQSLGNHLKKASQTGAQYAVILGAEELKKGQASVKDLNERKQTEVELDQLADYFAKVMNL